MIRFTPSPITCFALPFPLIGVYASMSMQGYTTLGGRLASDGKARVYTRDEKSELDRTTSAWPDTCQPGGVGGGSMVHGNGESISPVVHSSNLSTGHRYTRLIKLFPPFRTPP